MKKTKKVCLLGFLFIILLSVIPVASSLLFGVRESSVSAIVSQSQLSIHADRIRMVTVTDPITGERIDERKRLSLRGRGFADAD